MSLRTSAGAKLRHRERLHNFLDRRQLIAHSFVLLLVFHVSRRLPPGRSCPFLAVALRNSAMLGFWLCWSCCLVGRSLLLRTHELLQSLLRHGFLSDRHQTIPQLLDLLPVRDAVVYVDVSPLLNKNYSTQDNHDKQVHFV